VTLKVKDNGKLEHFDTQGVDADEGTEYLVSVSRPADKEMADEIGKESLPKQVVLLSA
jgi:hypothetical protein